MSTHIEERLRGAGAPPEPPAHFYEDARAAALGAAPRVVVRSSTIHPRGRSGRFLLAAAVLVASAVAALAIGVGGNSDPHVISTVTLKGASASTGASVQFLETDGPVRSVVVKAWGLKPAPEGSYYQLWMDPGDGVPKTAVVAFNTREDGTVEARADLPSELGWQRCWVTLANASSSDPVMAS